MEAGQKVMIETPTSKYYVGVVLEIKGLHTVRLGTASWVEFTGRLGEFIRNGETENSAHEYVIETTQHWIGWWPWNHELFTEDK